MTDSAGKERDAENRNGRPSIFGRCGLGSECTDLRRGPMDIEFAFLCHAADFGRIGPAAIGIGRHLVTRATKQLPFVGQLRFQAQDSGNCQIELELVGPDGHVIDREQGMLQLPPVGGGDLPYGHIAFVGEFRGLDLVVRGPHAIQIHANEARIGVIPFEVE